MELIQIIALIGYILFLMKRGVSFGWSMLSANSIVIVALYLFAIFGVLNVGLFAVSALGIILFFISAKYFVRNAKGIPKRALITSFLYGIPFLTVFYSVPAEYQFTAWDEFADWGLNLKYMHQTGELYSFSKLPYFDYRHYPPAQFLYQYFFLKFLPWSEKSAMYIQIFFLLSTQLSIFWATRNNRLYGAIAFFASLTLPLYFHFFYNTLLVDLMLAEYFAALFIMVMFSRPNFIEAILIVVNMTALLLLKQVGLIFVLILICVYFLKCLASQVRGLKQGFIFTPVFFNNELNLKRINYLIPFIYPVITSILVFIGYKSWEFFKKINEVPSNKTEVLPSLIKFFESPLSERMRDTVHLFLIRLSEQSFTLHIKFYVLIFALAGIGVLLPLMLRSKERFRDILLLGMVSVGSIIYLLFTLLSYIVFFSIDEGIVLSGFERYTAIYLISWSFILLAYLVRSVGSQLTSRLTFSAVLLCLLVLFPPVNFYQVITHNLLSNDTVEMRKKMDALIDGLPENIEGHKVFLVAQGYGGLVSRIFQYSIYPRVTRQECHSFGKKYTPEDYDTCNVSFIKSFSDSTHLLVYKADEIFWKSYGNYFEPNAVGLESGVFEVKRGEMGIQFFRMKQN
jgi:hypothetical protein